MHPYFAQSQSGRNYGAFLHYMRIIDPREFGDLPEPTKVFWRKWYNSQGE